MLITAVLCAVVLGGPTLPPRTPAQRLAIHITDVSPSASPYAVELAERIMFEAGHYGLDPALFAAIGFIESRFRLYPYNGRPETTLASPWRIYPTEEWLLIPRATRLRLSRDIVVSTARAALILARHVRRCKGGPVCYARYNRTPPRRGYIVALYRRARILRRILHGQ